MKDELKKFIGDHREAFDDQEPSEKIWHGVERDLSKMKQRSLWNSVVVWRAAAAVLFGLSVLLLVTRTSPAFHQTTKKEVANVQHDFSDMESFYRGEIAQKVELIRHYDSEGDNDEITQSFQKLDAMYLVLTDEMKNNPNKKLRDAMILNLLVRIDLLNQQLQKLEMSKKEKNSGKQAEA